MSEWTEADVVAYQERRQRERINAPLAELHEAAKRVLTPPRETEAGIQGRIVEVLRLSGYEVLVTSRVVKKCRDCGTYAASGTGDGASGGIGDLLVTRPGLSTWKMLEVKRPGGTIRPEQRRLVDNGFSTIVYNEHDALLALRGAEEAD